MTRATGALAATRIHALPFLCGALVLLTGISACQSSSAVTAPTDRPARLRAPGPACLDALTAFAVQATGRPVSRLSAAAFAQAGTLWLESGQIRDAQGRLLDGASLHRPQALHLTQNAAGRCVVTHAESGQQAPLPGCTCAALAASAP